MKQERLEEIKSEFYKLHPDDQAEDIADLIAEVEQLKTKVQELKDNCDQLEGERQDACDLRNLAYIERDELQAKNKNLRALLKSVADYLGTPWFNDWPTAQAKLSEVEAAIANLKEDEEL